jgi:hypothetical protein
MASKIRFKPFPESIKADTTDVIYLGGNTEAADSIKLKKMLPKLKSMHIIEPVPIFFQELKKNMAKYSSWAHLYPIGLGNSNRNISISPNDLKGQGTFVMNTTGWRRYCFEYTDPPKGLFRSNKFHWELAFVTSSRHQWYI